MAINKDKNTNLQITLSKKDFDTLLQIQEHISAMLCLDVNKSQAIAFLIRNFAPNSKESKPIKTALNKTADEPKKPIARAPKHKDINYQAQVKALKDKLGVSYTELSAMLSIPPSTLKKYGNGMQNPTGENEEIILKALKDYGIK